MDELDPPPSVTGYTNDEAIQNYRQALLLYKAQKYPEAVLAFSTFVERYADHPLAGNAQYYVGSSYLQQGEPKLALQELQRVLSAYDRSPMVSRALLDMALAEEKLQNREAAAKYRQLLISLFPMSPAAGELRKGVSSSENNPPVSPLGAPVPETAPAAIPTNDKEESE
jgi:tol-pal system protein YbgF